MKFWLEKSQRKRPHQRSISGQEVHTDINLKEFGSEGLDWILGDQEKIQWRAFVDTVMNLQFKKGREILDQLSN
jgi:hypothetical protein